MYCHVVSCWQLESQCQHHGSAGEAAFRAGFHGLLLKRGEEDAEGIRKPRFNLARDANPLWWAVVKDEADVQLAVRFARANNYKVAVCSAGQHTWHSQTNDVLIDMRNMKGVSVNTEQQLVTFKMGCTLGEVDEVSHASGQLHVPMGVVSHTGAGLVLGGGVGMLTRAYGATVDNLVGGKVVLANGEIVEASEEKNPDLLISLRGGGGFTGVVTEVTARAYPVTHAWAKVQALYLEQAAAQYDKFKAFFENPQVEAEKRATTYMLCGFSPEHLRCFMLIHIFTGPEDEAKAFFGSLEVEKIGTVFEGALPFPALQKMNDAGFPPAVWYSGALCTNESFPPEALFREMIEVWKNDKTAECGGIALEQRGGMWRSPANVPTLLGDRESNWDMVVFLGFKEPEGKDAKIEVIRGYKQRLKTCNSSFREVKAPNFQSDSIANHPLGPELRRIKNKFDPDNLFYNVFGL